MPRGLDCIQLTSSEENILSNKGYEISTKLGEGAYAKVRSYSAFCSIDVKSSVLVYWKGISE